MKEKLRSFVLSLEQSDVFAFAAGVAFAAFLVFLAWVFETV